VHAIDHLYPDTALHGELAGVGAVFAAHLQEDPLLVAELSNCLARHGLPRTHRDLGLSDEQFVNAVAYAPSTRPDRFTILEHLDLDEEAILDHVNSYANAVAG